MGSFLEIALGISTPLKLAWGVWIAWAAGQVAWYRLGRIIVLPRMNPTPRPVRKPPTAASTELSEAAPV